MARYIIKRLLWIIPIMLGVLIIVFTISYLTPGDPIATILGAAYTEETYAAKAAELHLDKGYFGQLFSYIWNLITKFDFGKSYYSNIAVAKELISRFPTTASLGLVSITLTALIGIPLGVISAIRQYSALDYALTCFAMIMAAIPGFVLAILCLVLFSAKLGWFPISGLGSFRAWVLPVLTNAFPTIAMMMRMTRTTMLEVIRQDYIRTARAKGLREGIIIRKHALRNCLIPLVTILGGSITMAFGGSIICENIFNIRGIGTYLYSGITARDYPIINGSVLYVAFLVCVINLVVDCLYAVIDPRIKAQYQRNKSKVKRSLQKKGAAETC